MHMLRNSISTITKTCSNMELAPKHLTWDISFQIVPNKIIQQFYFLEICFSFVFKNGKNLLMTMENIKGHLPYTYCRQTPVRYFGHEQLSTIAICDSILNNVYVTGYVCHLLFFTFRAEWNCWLDCVTNRQIFVQ